ncbi:MAG TPA: hypothetical protein VER12_03395 [Polyangiaceae bacterium]|nr:hypothetical protein [Polyangiaceae bacterium]
MKRTLAPFLLLATTVCAGCAAGSAAPASAPSTAPIGELSRYLPLLDDSVLSYETYIEDTNERGIAVFEIDRPRPELAELKLAGQVRKRYYFEPGGVRSSHGGYLLKLPLSLNAEWTGDDGKVKLTQVDLSVDTPAGKFAGCLQTIENAQLGAATRKTTTVFCPGVGITVLEIDAAQEGTSVLQRLTLKAFGPRFKAP